MGRSLSSALPRRTLLVAVVVLLAILAAAPAAHASVIKKWYGIQPTGTVGTNIPIMISGGATADGYLLDDSTIKLYIDGALYPRTGYYASSRSGTGLYLSCSPSPELVDGAHTFRVEISDVAGKLSAYQWGATIAQAPSASFTSPAAGATLYNGSPAIALSLADNTPGALVSVAGRVRSGSATGPVIATFGGAGLAQGTAAFALESELAPGTYYLTATVTDAAGHSTALTGASARQFTTAVIPAMSIPPADCLASGCHVNTAHPATGIPCASCHVAGYHESNDCGADNCHGAHAGPVTVTGVIGTCQSCHSASYPSVPRHSETSVTASHTSSCEGCHVESLMTRHAAVEGSVYANQCDVCHASTDPLVKAAIAAGDVACSACHDREQSHGDLDAIHQSTVTSGFVQVLSYQVSNHSVAGDYYDCGMCHSSMNLLNAHGTGWNNCAVCHASGGAVPTGGTWNKTCQQGGCHVTLHDQPNADANHVAKMNGGGLCGYCHSGVGYNFYYEAQDCAVVCHTSKVAAVGDSIAPVTSVSNAAAYFNSPAQVQLTATDASSVSGTYYRVNGGAWTFNTGASTTASVPAGGAGLLEYYSVDWFGNAEVVRSYSVVFDVTPPVTMDDHLTHPVEYPWRLVASDAGSGVATTYFSVDGGSFRVYGFFENIDGIRTDGSGGPHTIRYYSVDRVGNVEPTVTVDFVISDLSAPTSYLSTQAGTSAYIESVDEYSDNPCGVKEIRYRLDGGEWVVTSFPKERPYFTMPRRVDIVVPGDGSYQLEYYAVDWADNAETPRTTTLVIDNVLPALVTDAADSYVGWASIHATATDGGSGVASVTYQIDSYSPTTVSGASATITLSPPLAGTRTYSVRAWATDRCGNTSELFGPKTIVVYPALDAAPPTAGFRKEIYPYSVVEGGHYATDTAGTPPMKFRVYADDYTTGVASLSYQVDGGTWQQLTPSSVTGSLAAVIDLGWGTHTVSYYAVDGAGNEGAVKTITFTVEPGSLTFFFNMSNLLYADGVADWSDQNYSYDVSIFKDGQLVGDTYHQSTWDTAAEPDYVHPYNFVSFPGAGAGPYDVQLVLHTKNRGDQTFWWYAHDDAAPGELWLSEGYYDVVDGLALEAIPPVTYPSESSGDTIESDSGVVEIQLMAYDDGGTGVASLHFQVDGGGWQSTPGSATSFDLIGHGTHTVEYYAVDNAGNIEATQALTLNIVAPPLVRFSMTNTGNTNPFVTDATWLSAPYNYDIEVFSGDGLTLWDYSGNTWGVDANGVRIEPQLSLSLALTGQRIGPFTAVVTIANHDGMGSQTYTLEDFTVDPGQVYSVTGTFSDSLEWFVP